VSARELITEHLDLWTGAVTQKSTRGRGSNSKIELTGNKRLRELILELAVRGKLIEQNSGDDPASSLIAEVRNQRCALVGERQLGKQTELSEVTNTEVPYQLPKGWGWCRLGDLAEIIRGVTYKKHQVLDQATDNHIVLLRANNIQETITDDALIYVPLELVNDRQLITKGDILIAMSSGSANLVGKAAQTNRDLQATFGAFCGAVRPLKQKISSYLGLYMTTPLYRDQAQASGKGIGINNLNKKALNNMLVPVPPEKEQHRIVQKVDELMALCDRLEQQTSDQLEAHETLVDTLLDTLTQSKNATELAENWARLAAHFDTLFTTEKSIDKLKQTILQLAVMGRLVDQDAEDEPATSIVSRASRIKAQLLADKLIKKQKELPGITEAEKPSSIPSHWTYARLDDVCTEITSGSTPPKSEFNEAFGVPYLKVYNIRSQRINFKYKPQFITGEYHQTSLKRSKLLPGDVVMNIVGPPLGKTAVIPADYPEWNCNQAIVRFRPIEIELNHFIHLYLKAGIFLDTMELIGTAGQDNISVTKSRSIVIPLPPKAEQHRIVQKVDELMTLCDQLKERLNQASGTRCQLAEAAADKALN
jgi:type I restriction enzyme S subunit